jgi:hypothetical protein
MIIMELSDSIERSPAVIFCTVHTGAGDAEPLDSSDEPRSMPPRAQGNAGYIPVPNRGWNLTLNPDCGHSDPRCDML